MRGLDVEPIKDPTKLEIKQSKTPHLPRLPMRSLFLANSSGGKTTLIVNLLLNKKLDRGVFSTCLSSSAHLLITMVLGELSRNTAAKSWVNPRGALFR